MPTQITHPSPLRYPGGKGQLANYMKMLVMENNFSDGEYAEVFAGGAGVALALLLEEYVHEIHINDLDLAIYAFWHSVLNETDELCRLISDTAVSMDEWYIQREIRSDLNNHTLIEAGFNTFFLNRTNRSGILNGGVIGGYAQNGDWQLDARYNKTDLIQRIQRIAKYAGRINLYNLDAAEFITNVLSKISGGAFVYFDPPYYNKGKKLYDNHYTHADHGKIADLVINHVRQPWVVSYDLTKQIEDIYNGQEHIKYKVDYTAQDRYAGAEVMYHSKDIVLPAVVEPTKVTRDDIKNFTLQFKLAV